MADIESLINQGFEGLRASIKQLEIKVSELSHNQIISNTDITIVKNELMHIKEKLKEVDDTHRTCPVKDVEHKANQISQWKENLDRIVTVDDIKNIKEVTNKNATEIHEIKLKQEEKAKTSMKEQAIHIALIGCIAGVINAILVFASKFIN